MPKYYVMENLKNQNKYNITYKTLSSLSWNRIMSVIPVSDPPISQNSTCPLINEIQCISINLEE